MSDFLKLKDIYKEIYNTTLEISTLTKEGNIDGIQPVLNKRKDLISNADAIVSNTELTEEEQVMIKEIVATIKTLENDNIEQLQIRQNAIKKELSKISLNFKAIKSYKYGKSPDPRLIDSKE